MPFACWRLVTLADQCVKRALPLGHRRARDDLAIATSRQGRLFLSFDRILELGSAWLHGVAFLDQQNSVPSIHIRCKMTASLRATATRALFMLLRFEMRMPQASSADHLATRVSRTLAASY